MAWNLALLAYNLQILLTTSFFLKFLLHDPVKDYSINFRLLWACSLISDSIVNMQFWKWTPASLLFDSTTNFLKLCFHMLQNRKRVYIPPKQHAGRPQFLFCFEETWKFLYSMELLLSYIFYKASTPQCGWPACITEKLQQKPKLYKSFIVV